MKSETKFNYKELFVAEKLSGKHQKIFIKLLGDQDKVEEDWTLIHSKSEFGKNIGKKNLNNAFGLVLKKINNFLSQDQ